MDRFSDESEGSDPQGYLEDRELARQRSPTPPSSRTPPPSSEGDSSRRRHRHRDRHADVLKMLMDEEQLQSRTTRKFLRTALQRLDNETLRAQKAESQALEIAQRFKIVGDAHRQLQADLSRAHEELRLYKVQYDNAQREIHRGQDILKTLEQQRDEAEARAAKDRTTARRLREEQLTTKAREEGRKAGYQEGLKRGLEQARFERLHADLDAAPAEDDAEMDADPDSTTDSRTDPLDAIGMRNFSSPSANAITIESPVPRHTIPPLSAPSAPPGEQGSRFREHGIGATPGPRPTSLASGSQPWNQAPIRPVSVQNASPSPHPENEVPPDGWIPPTDDDGIIRLPPPHELRPPASPHSPSAPLPIILRPPSSTRADPTPPPGKDYAYGKRGSQESIPLSIPSTTISQFDLVSTPGHSTPGHSAPSINGRDRRQALSVIQEVSSSMEHSPGLDSRGIPEPITFPISPAERAAAQEEFPSGQGSRRSRQRLADELRYEDPNVPEEWRHNAELRSASSKQSLPRRRPSNLTTPTPLSPDRNREYRPSSAASGTSGVPHRSRSVMSHSSDKNSSVAGRYPPSSVQDWIIDVIPPSGPPSSTFSPVAAPTMGMLSPNGMLSALPPPQPVRQHPPNDIPTAPNSPSMGRHPSMGQLPDNIRKVNDLPPGFLPSGPVTPVAPSAALAPPNALGPPRSTTPSIYGPPPTQVPRVQRSSSSSSSSGPPPNEYPRAMQNRSRSAGQSFASAGDEMRSKTPGGRPPSAASSSASRPAYPVAPTPSNIQYPAPPGAPAGTLSPRSVASRMSGHQRSLSLDAGSTPAPSSRPLSTAPPPMLRRMPSDSSTNSAFSGASGHGPYKAYDKNEYVDAAFLASNEDLTANVLSPHTSANTRANASTNRRSANTSGSRHSPALSYASLQR